MAITAGRTGKRERSGQPTTDAMLLEMVILLRKLSNDMEGVVKALEVAVGVDLRDEGED